MRGIFASCALSALLLAAAWADHHHGADGSHTHEEYEQVNEAYEHLFHMMGHSEEHHQVDLGSGVAFQTGYSPLEKFQNDVKDDYFGRIFTVNFTKPAEAVDDINKLIANRTNNMITDMVKDLDPRTIMMIINYVYFRGQWEEPFDANHSQKAVFNVDENTKVQVDMMKRKGRDMFYHTENPTTVIKLPYKGNTSMMIVLPEEGKMKEVEVYINKDHVKHWHDSVIRSVFLNLSIPTSGFENPCVLGFIYKSIPFIMSMHYKSSIFCLLPLFLRVISSVITLSSNNSLIFLFLPVVFLWCYVKCSYAVCHLCGTPFMFVPIKHPMNH
ncbi:hypothetical protein F7725_019290 [Dissostichus mawsoni]|uniref:Serpin domain-containing protein n=1 Tax=Dissostichus mawsoni TaxID=36200 RepID=A0A7J5YKS2_DISMA|nr:hypothetical protein F7725_019290 [Dissostichus mawsoni]